MNKNRWIAVLTAILILAGAGTGVFLIFNHNSGKSRLPAEEPGAEGTADASMEAVIPLSEMNLPDVVAVINGREIDREQLLRDYRQMKVLYESAEIDTSLPETLAFMKEALISDLITTTLLDQEADREGIEVEEARVDEKMEEAISKFSSEKEYRAMLKDLDMTESALREKLKRQLRISDLMRKRVDEAVDGADGLQFSEEEKRKMYAIIEDQLGGMPSYEEAEQTVDQMLEYSKVQIILGDYIQTLIDEGEIEIRIP